MKGSRLVDVQGRIRTRLLVGLLLGLLESEPFKKIVRKPSKDICSLCYQFHLGNRTTTSTPNNQDNDESSLQSDGENEEDDYEDGALMEACERETQKIANEIKQHIEDVTSMRALWQKAIEEAKTATKNAVADEEMVITLWPTIAKTWRCLSLERISPVKPTITPLKQSTYLGL
jgi:hypothetical protein